MAYAPYLTCHEVGFEMGHRWLFKGLSFAVHPGERWGVVGPNGAGKSTFFKLLAGRLKPDEGVVAVRNGIRVATVTQDFHFEKHSTVLQHLRHALGFDADVRVRELEAELTTLGEQAAKNPALLEDKSWSNSITTLQNELSEIEGISSANLLESIVKIGGLQGLEERLVSELSGGQQKRLQIVSALLSQPQLILLDEPTNHLDVQTVEWLEEFLLEVAEKGVGLLGMRQKHIQEEPFAFVLISHDRALLDTLVNEVLEISDGKAKSYHGNFEAYMEQKIASDMAAEKQVARMANLFRRELSWLRSGTKARTTKQTARIERALSLQKTLGTERQIVAPRKQMEASFQSQLTTFQRNEDDQFAPVVRSLGSQQLVVFKNVDIAYPGQGERFVVKSLNLNIRAGQRLALLGPNGCGKTTMMRTIVGENTPAQGELTNHELVHFAYFDQGRANLSTNESVRQIIAPRGDTVTLHGRQIHVMSYFDRFMFTKGDTEKLVNELSGGERARLLLAKLMLEDANFLVLDEPTNDLDIGTLQVLEQNLIEFKGAIVFTSHDRYFIQKVATDILAYTGEQRQRDGTLSGQWELFKDLEQALSALEKNQPQAQTAKPITAKTDPSIATQNVSKESKKTPKASFKEVREFEQLEKRIHELERLIATKTSELESAYAAAKAFTITSHLSAEIHAAQQELNTSTKRWEELFEKML